MSAPIRAELRCWGELARLLADGRFRSPGRAGGRRPVLLIPGFMAGDASLTVLAGWLRRRGHAVRGSGMRINVDCAGRMLGRLGDVLVQIDEPAIVIGQSRGGVDRGVHRHPAMTAVDLHATGTGIQAGAPHAALSPEGALRAVGRVGAGVVVT